MQRPSFTLGTRRLKDRAAAALGVVESIVAAIGIGPQDAGIGGEMGLRMLAPAIARVIEHGGRPRRSREWPIVPHIGPTSADGGLALGQHRHSRVVGMEPLAGKDMSLDAREDWLHHGANRAHLVGQGRQAQRHALAGIAFGLAVQRLMLAELLERDHRQQAGAGPAAGNHMKGRRRLADRLAVAAGELLTHMLDHLPLPGDHLERRGDIFAELAQPRSTTARAGGGRWNDNPLSRQMIREWLAGGSLTREGRYAHPRLGRRHLGGNLVHGSRGLQLLKLQLHLIHKPRGALGVRPVAVAVELGNLELQMCDQRLIIGKLGTSHGEFGLGQRRLGLRLRQRRFQRFKLFRGGRQIGVHDTDRIIKPAV